MSDVFVFEGRLRFPAGMEARWRESPAQAPSGLADHTGLALSDLLGSVDDALSSLVHEHDGVQVETVPAGARDSRTVPAGVRDEVRITGLLRDDELAAWSVVVAVVAQAAGFGASGEVRLRSETEDVLTVSEGGWVWEADLPVRTGPLRLPGVIEAARSGRSRCGSCGDPIDQGVHRFGLRDARGARQTWFHVPCAAVHAPHSLGPVLRDSAGVPDREALLASLPSDALQEPHRPDKGERARVVSGPSAGVEGTVFWLGPERAGTGLRAGVEAGGRKHWVAWTDVEWVRS
ncbi:MAG: hypothetical protein R3F61_36535 [Myxococcota bacterium]